MLKTMGHIILFTIPGMDRWDERCWSPALICHANQSNENLHNFASGLYWNHVAAFYQVGCIDKSRNKQCIKQRNIHEQGNPSVKSQFWNLQTCTRVGTSPKATHLFYAAEGSGYHP